MFEQFVNVLAVGALLLAAVKTYLIANKLWSRKHDRVVAESISVWAQLIGIVTSLPFMIRYVLIDGDYMSLANMTINLALTVLYLMIGVGLWLSLDGEMGLWTKAKRALRLERKESLNLIYALIRPAGASIILDVLRKIAMIDNDLDDKEKALIQEFADAWNIRIDFHYEDELTTEQTTEQLYVDLRNRVADYLAISPDRTQASQFLDIVRSLVGVDEIISSEETFILDEIRGMVESYVHRDGAATVFSVIVVPQSPEERAAIQALLPNVTPQPRWGGNVYSAGEYHSRPFAEMISEKYQVLSFFSTVKVIDAPAGG